MDDIFKQRIITIRNISPYLTMQEIRKENLKDFVIHKLIKDGSTFHIYMSHADGDTAVKKLEKDLKALPMRLDSVKMKLHSNILCVMGITPSINEEILQQVLLEFGEILLPFKLIRSKKTNDSKGYGWLVYKDIKSAEKCIWSIPKIDIQSQPLRAGWAGNNVTCEDDLSSVSTVYVEGLPPSIISLNDLRQFLSKNDEIAFCQFLVNEDPASQSQSQTNFAVVEFKNSEAAEQCVIENNYPKVGGVLQLMYAIPGYSCLDFVWNKPVNIQFKPRSQMTPGYPNTIEQISSHYVPMSDVIRPQLVGVRPFVYPPTSTALHNIQIQPYLLHPDQRSDCHQTQQAKQFQQQQTTNEYQPQTPLELPDQLPTQQLSNQQQPLGVEIQQQRLVQNQTDCPDLASIHSVVQQNQQVKVGEQPPSTPKESELNRNLLQQPRQMSLLRQQQIKQNLVAKKESRHVEHKEEELSQKQLEELTVKYQQEEQQRQKQQHQQQQHQIQQDQQQKHQERLQQKQKQQKQQQQEQEQKQQQKQQQQPLPKLTEINHEMKVIQHSRQTEPVLETEHQNQESRTRKHQKVFKKANQHNSDAHNETEKLKDCQEHLQSSKFLTSTDDQTEEVSAQIHSNSVLVNMAIINEKRNEKQKTSDRNQRVNNGNDNEFKGCTAQQTKNIENTDQNQFNEKVMERNKEHKQSKEETKDLKQVVSLKQNEADELSTLKKDADIKQTEKEECLQQKTLKQKPSLKAEKEYHKDSRKRKPETKLPLAPKEKLLLLQQQIKRQAEALERLTRSKTKPELNQESNNNDYNKIPEKVFGKTSEKTPSEAESDFVVTSEVKLLKKREDTIKGLLPNKDSLKVTEWKEEKTAPRRSASKIRLAQRMDIYEESEIKEKRPRLEGDESQLHNFTEKIPSSNILYKTIPKAADLNSMTLTENGNEENSKHCVSDGVVSMPPIKKKKPQKSQTSKSPKKNKELVSTSNEATPSLCSLANHMNLKDEPAQVTTKKDELMNITTTPEPKITAKDVSESVNNPCKESDVVKEVSGKSIPNESEKLKIQQQAHCKYQESDVQVLDKQSMNVTVQEKLKVRPSVSPGTATVPDKRKLLKSVEKSSPVVVVVDSKAVNVSSNMKMPERNFKNEVGQMFNQTGIIRPTPKLPMQSISSHGIVPEFPGMPLPSQFSHLHPQINNMQQFQTFTNNQFQPIMRAEAGMGRKFNSVFNHPILSPMPPAHMLTQNDTFTTNTHYDPVMMPSPLLIGVPGMPGHTSHHIARPIPHIPTQPWQTMPLPPMMHPRMTHYPPLYRPVLPNISNIGMSRNAPEFYSKIPERLPKIQPDTAFHPPYNHLPNIQMRFAGRNLNDEAPYQMSPYKVDPTAPQFRNYFSNERPAMSMNCRDIHGYNAVNFTNIGRNEEIPNVHSPSVQMTENRSYLPSKFVTYEQLVREQGNPNKNESKKMETKYLGAKQPTLKPVGNFKQSVKVPQFNRTVRELISVPFTSDESRLLYLLKKKHQGHPIAQEWLFIGNSLLTTHFRKLWDPPLKEEELQNDFEEEVKTDCVCRREPDTLKCYGCSKQFFGRVRYHCELHPYREYLTDFVFCPYCGIDLAWTEEPW